jgi:hypothetical protein
MHVSGDILRYLELDRFVDMYVAESTGDIEPEKDLLIEYTKKNTEHFKIVTQKVLSMEHTIFIANIVYQFLFHEFGITNHSYMKGLRKEL